MSFESVLAGDTLEKRCVISLSSFRLFDWDKLESNHEYFTWECLELSPSPPKKQKMKVETSAGKTQVGRKYIFTDLNH